MKWKVQPMDKWRKERDLQRGSFAVGYDSGESRRIKKACQRGDDINFISWYPLVAWDIDRVKCESICANENISCEKSSCFMCPNMRTDEWIDLRKKHPELYNIAINIERQAVDAGNADNGGLIRGSLEKHMKGIDSQMTMTDDMCHHGGCFT
jgi:hypothetical protein